MPHAASQPPLASLFKPHIVSPSPLCPLASCLSELTPHAASQPPLASLFKHHTFSPSPLGPLPSCLFELTPHAQRRTQASLKPHASRLLPLASLFKLHGVTPLPSLFKPHTVTLRPSRLLPLCSSLTRSHLSPLASLNSRLTLKAALKPHASRLTVSSTPNSQALQFLQRLSTLNSQDSSITGKVSNLFLLVIGSVMSKNLVDSSLPYVEESITGPLLLDHEMDSTQGDLIEIDDEEEDTDEGIPDKKKEEKISSVARVQGDRSR
ncbi:hypothetical protein O6P43_030224 [Quillaja saponaria]|uniref:Uncharacterized protein n=1 Tax=Quillaja saponaria TaxID=32244 RepID=A0AAD7PC02_QUISA|nr:hypothetical protein O6P43_030224 [Quillaja saponaria]